MSDERIWRALADPSRRDILDRLRSRPHTTGELADRFDMTRYGVMKHLSVLVDAGLVLVRRRGRQRWNYLNVVPLQEALERWATPFQRSTARSLMRLRDLSESHGREESTMVTRPEILQIEQEIRIAAPPGRVFKALTEEVSEWWGRGYRLLDEDSTVKVIPHVGEHMLETSGSREASWGMVTSVEPDRELELTGRMGMGGAVTGVIRYELEPDGAGTLLKLSHHATGEIDEDTEANYTKGWQYLLGECLRGYLDESHN